MSEDFTLEELVSLPNFYHQRVSPEGDKVAFYWDKTGRIELYVMSLHDCSVRQLSDGEVSKSPRWPICWGVKGDYIYYHLDESGNEQNDIHRISLEKGHTEPVVTLEGQNIIGRPSPDGRYLCFNSDHGEQMNIFLKELPGGATQQLTDYENPAFGGIWHPEGKLIGFTTNETDDLKNMDAYLFDVEKEEVEKLPLGNKGSETDLHDWSPYGEQLLVSDDSSGYRKVGIYHLEEERLTWLTNVEREENPLAFGPEGEKVYATRSGPGGWEPLSYKLTDGESAHFFDLETGVVSAPEGRYGTITADGDFVFGHTTSAKRKNMLAYESESDSAEVLLEAEYGDIDPDLFQDSTHITYRSSDGLEVPALLYRPDDLDPEEKVPGIVYVHGGPHARATKSFDSFLQYLVNRNYGVLQPNYRGSTGHGKEYKEMIHGDWAGGDLEDVAHGGHFLADQDWIDEDKLIVFGGSYGGYMTYMQLVRKPELWATGVAYVGITDLISMYEESMEHFKYFLRQQMGDPQENEQLWRERSAITQIDNLQPPLLIVHGVNDPRCPISQARKFRDRLKEMGWEEGEQFEYVELGEEGHGSMDIKQRIQLFQTLEDYLRRRVKDLDSRGED